MKRMSSRSRGAYLPQFIRCNASTMSVNHSKLVVSSLQVRNAAVE